MGFLRDQSDDVVMLGTELTLLFGNRIVDGFPPLTKHSESYRGFSEAARSKSPTLVVKRELGPGGRYRFGLGPGEI